MTEPLIDPENVAYPHVKRWTLEECEKLLEIEFIPRRAQLVNGVICLTKTPSPACIYTIQMLFGWFHGQFDALNVDQRAYFTIPGELGKYNVLEPSVGVMYEPITAYYPNHPGAKDMRVVAEVSDDTLHFNLTTKAALYAQVGIPEYLVLNVAERQIHRHRVPVNGRYRDIVILGENDNLTLLDQTETIRVGELFPTLPEA